MFYLAVLYVLT
jgi:hypothetical protein